MTEDLCKECEGLGWQGPPGNAEDCEICGGTGLAKNDCGDKPMTERLDEIRKRNASNYMGCTVVQRESDIAYLLAEVDRSRTWVRGLAGKPVDFEDLVR